jgi:mono/diheme cytochrome c family protein
MKIILTVLITIAAMIVIGLGIVFLGFYDVSASKPEGAVRQWAFSTAMDNSVARQAKRIVAPPLSDSAQIQTGYLHYSEMCVTCHGAPGIKPSEIGQGLNPLAPDLSEAVSDLSDAKLYWILKHGIRMTGMPAFGKTHNEDALWAMVSFVRLLPKMTPAEFQSYGQAQNSEEEAKPEELEHHHSH